MLGKYIEPTELGGILPAVLKRFIDIKKESPNENGKVIYTGEKTSLDGGRGK